MTPRGYYEWIQKRTFCCTCGIRGKVDASHLEAVGMGRNRKKELLLHYSLIPQCRTCHIELHKLGLDRYEREKLLNLYKINQKYLVAYIYENTLVGNTLADSKIQEITENV